MSQPIFALIDCNNFFVSSERIFRPDLEGKSVVVLSSNDGCVVARSNESKKLGIPMGVPAFKMRDLFRDNHVVQFSANFELYGNVSRRITDILTAVTPRIEVYSVDESFLDLSELDIKDYAVWGKTVRERILREIGIPVSIGIAPSKTLAKLGADLAKTDDKYSGVIDLLTCEITEKEALLAAVPLKDVWGVGWRLAPKLRAEGVNTALSLSHLRPQHAQQLMGIRGRQLVSELQGISCFPLEREKSVRHSLARTRIFGEDTHVFHVLESAIASLTAQAAGRLRGEHLLARRAAFFLTTNRNKPGYRKWAQDVTFTTPTNDTGLIITKLLEAVEDVYNDKQQYHRAGVLLFDFVPVDHLQTDLLGLVNTADHDRSMARMKAVDIINKRFGKNRVHYAAEDLSKAWEPKRKLRSPRYVSHWDELPTATLRLRHKQRKTT
jgi:DNA polymerase V